MKHELYRATRLTHLALQPLVRAREEESLTYLRTPPGAPSSSTAQMLDAVAGLRNLVPRQSTAAPSCDVENVVGSVLLQAPRADPPLRVSGMCQLAVSAMCHYYPQPQPRSRAVQARPCCFQTCPTTVSAGRS